MADLFFQPLSTKWPKPATRKPRASGWAVTSQRAAEKLSQELDRLGVREATVELDGVLADFRKMGAGLYRDARLKSMKVLVRFHLSEIGEVQYACDAYHRWHENLHAVGMTLERLRLIDQYEATVAGARQQYRGFKRLGSGGEASASDEVLDPMEAAAVVVRHALADATPDVVRMLVSLILADAEQMRLYVRKAERNTHPDQGGKADNFAHVGRAKAVLQTHHAGTHEEATV